MYINNQIRIELGLSETCIINILLEIDKWHSVELQ